MHQTSCTEDRQLLTAILYTVYRVSCTPSIVTTPTRTSGRNMLTVHIVIPRGREGGREGGRDGRREANGEEKEDGRK